MRSESGQATPRLPIHPWLSSGCPKALLNTWGTPGRHHTWPREALRYTKTPHSWGQSPRLVSPHYNFLYFKHLSNHLKHVQTKTCTRMFTVALLRAKRWTQPAHAPQVEEQRRLVHATGQRSATNRGGTDTRHHVNGPRTGRSASDHSGVIPRT